MNRVRCQSRLIIILSLLRCSHYFDLKLLVPNYGEAAGYYLADHIFLCVSILYMLDFKPEIFVFLFLCYICPYKY